MNRYAATAMTYYRDHLPTRYAELDNPDDYFRDLGDRIQDQVADLTPKLAGPDQPDEGYLDKLGRLNAAKSQAEEIVLRDLVYSQAPENVPEDLDPETAQLYGDLNQTLADLANVTMNIFDEKTPSGGSGSAGPEGSSKSH